MGFCEKSTVFLECAYDDEIMAKRIRGIKAWVQLLTVTSLIPCLKKMGKMLPILFLYFSLSISL